VAEFFSTYWANIILSLITAGALAFCRWTWSQMKNYRTMLEERETEAHDE
jgi:hypothetical protein